MAAGVVCTWSCSPPSTTGRPRKDPNADSLLSLVGLLHCAAYRREYVVVARPWSVQEFCDESALARSDCSPIHDHFELSELALLELDWFSQLILDQRSETRCLTCRDSSRVAVNDANGHAGEYSNEAPELACWL